MSALPPIAAERCTAIAGQNLPFPGLSKAREIDLRLKGAVRRAEVLRIFVNGLALSDPHLRSWRCSKPRYSAVREAQWQNCAAASASSVPTVSGAGSKVAGTVNQRSINLSLAK
jgi:hypothetical protein